jgi:hypothetical protein
LYRGRLVRPRLLYLTPVIDSSAMRRDEGCESQDRLRIDAMHSKAAADTAEIAETVARSRNAETIAENERRCGAIENDATRRAGSCQKLRRAAAMQ